MGTIAIRESAPKRTWAQNCAYVGKEEMAA